MNEESTHGSFYDRVPDGLPQYSPQIKTGITGRYDLYSPDPNPASRAYRLRRGFDDSLSENGPGNPERRAANLPDYFASQFRVWCVQQKLGLDRNPFERQYFDKYMNEEIDVYPGQFPCLKGHSPFRCDREEASRLLSISYSEFDVLFGFERPRKGRRKAFVVQSAGQVHPGFHGKRNIHEGFTAPRLVELVFKTTPALHTWASDFSISLWFLDRFHMIPLTSMAQQRHAEFGVFQDNKVLAANANFGGLQLTIVAGFRHLSPDEFVGHVFLWFSIKPETFSESKSSGLKLNEYE